VSVLIQRYEDVSRSRNLSSQSFANTQLLLANSSISKSVSHANGLFSAAQNIVDAQKVIADDEYAVNEKNKSLEKLLASADEYDLRSARLAIEQKERALADAVDNLQNYIITAPFDGIIAAINLKEGDEIVSGAAAATIITDSQIAVITLNEVDIARIKTGQKATLSFSAIDGLTVTGKVADVGVLGSVSQGVVNYQVTIALDHKSEQIKSGMSVSAVIVTDIRQNVLIIPAAAVKIANDGSAYVLMPPSGESGAKNESVAPRQQPVVLGLADDTAAEIISGLVEGDWVAISSSKQNVSSSSATQGSGTMFNVGGMGGPMMR